MGRRDRRLHRQRGRASRSIGISRRRAQKLQRRLQLTGELARGALNSDEVFALYEPPAPSGLTDNPDRRAAGRAEVIEVDDPSVPTEVVLLERTPTDGNTFDELPFALTPGPADRHQAAAGGNRIDGGPGCAPGCRNSPAPRCSTSCCAARPGPAAARTLPRGGDAIDDITAALLDLDSSYVAVHGPPGTGKTYTAARVITRLVAEHGWRIGVVAQSHAVVENLLRRTIDAGIDPLRVSPRNDPTATTSGGNRSTKTNTPDSSPAQQDA